MRISEAFCKMRLAEYCSPQDIDRAIAVTVDSFVSSQKISCKRALARAFAKYVSFYPPHRPTSCLTLLTFVSFHRYTLAKPTSQKPARQGASRLGPRGGRGPAAVEA